MRNASRILLALVVILPLSSTPADAVSCWQCPGARDTCNYYTGTTFDHCINGCRRMGFNHEEDSCQQSCGEDALGRENDCIDNEQDCNRTCGTQGNVSRPWYIPY
ncbi:MAG TPA: hypothetical protein VGR62_20275 [Candidatus Binatia bacterium]|jgi:hypothetical protein|nr:hypothetical protein [Candidatus Binatia bacterium]